MIRCSYLKFGMLIILLGTGPENKLFSTSLFNKHFKSFVTKYKNKEYKLKENNEVN